MVGAVITTCGYFAVGLPLGALLAFTAKMGLNGIWWGNAAALVSSGGATLLYIFLHVDWGKEVRSACVGVWRWRGRVCVRGRGCQLVSNKPPPPTPLSRPLPQVLKANARLREASRLREQANWRRRMAQEQQQQQQQQPLHHDSSADWAGLGQAFLEGE